MRPIKGYTYKNYPGLRLVVRDDLASLYSEREWIDFCCSLFEKTAPVHLRKQTSAKEIFALRLSPQEQGMSCLVKKYKSRGLAKITKNIFRGSRAFHEFHSARAIDERGIPTAVPLLAAERMKWGCVYESLLVLPFISAACELKDFFLDPQNTCSRACSSAERWDFIYSFGRLTAKIFQSGIYQNDYSLNNFLIRAEEGSHTIYFIDFERAAIKKEITEFDQTELLAKLNRVGPEVTVKNRLRFLRGYLETAAATHKKLSPYARELQEATLAMIRRDLQRGRLTSIYTSGAYEKFRTAGIRGMHKSGYCLEEITKKLAALPSEVKQAAVTISCGSDECSLIVARMEHGNAESMWAAINALKIAGLPLEMPHIYAETETSGFLLLQLPEGGMFPAPEAISRKAGPWTMKVIEAHFPEELKKIYSVYRMLKSRQES